MSCANAEAVTSARHKAKTNMKTFLIVSFPFLKEGPKKPFDLFAFNLIANNPKTNDTRVLSALHYSDSLGRSTVTA